jgi:hypothetical protein
MAAPEAPLALKHLPPAVQPEAALPPLASHVESQPAQPAKPNIASGRAAELERAQHHESIELKKDNGGVLATIKNAFALMPKLPSKVAGLHRLIAPYSYRSLLAEKVAEPNEGKSGETLLKIGNKRFKLSGGAWIDDEYEADKDLPLIVVVRDSALYKELISGSGEMKLYLTSIPNGQGAIIVYKGKVYKLLPVE